MESARVVVEVVAGLIPGKDPDPTLTRRWGLTSIEWAEAEDQYALLSELNARALEYASTLMLQPDRLNWVRTDWIWL